MCHAAVRLIDNVSNAAPHGAEFKRWGRLATKTFPEIGPVTTCHHYEIDYKVRTVCESIGYSFGCSIQVVGDLILF
jgi:hypothetical protein